MTDRIPLDGIEPEEFAQLVELLAAWIVKGEVKVRFRFPSMVVFDFSEENISQQLERQKLPKACLPQLTHDIPIMLSGILTGHRNSVTAFLLDHAAIPRSKGAAKPKKQEIREEILSRIQSVEDKVLSAELRRQYAAKRTSKNSIYLDASWDIVEKRDESTGNPPSNLVYATVRISAQRPLSNTHALSFFSPFILDLTDTPFADSLTLTMTLEDLKDLAETLEKASKSLKREMASDGAR